MVEVAQEDRDAAAAILPTVNEECGLLEQGLMRQGEFDKDPLVQAFARHRLSAHPQPTGDVGALVEALDQPLFSQRQRLKELGYDSFREAIVALEQAAATILALTAEVERKDALLEGRDKFIASRLLWDDFVNQLPRAAIGKAEQ